MDFDPVRAKAAGEKPASICKRLGLTPEMLELFPSRLVNSELGEIPEGWEGGTLADLSVLNPEVWTHETRPAEIEYVDLSNTKWGRIEAIMPYTTTDAPSRAQRVLRPGDTIVGTVRPGNGSYALIFDADLTGSTGFVVLRPRLKIYTEFLYLEATKRGNIDVWAHLADGGAYPAIRPEVIATTRCVIPNDDTVVSEFSHLTCTLFANIARNDHESYVITNVRDILLPKLVLGELQVKDTVKLNEET
ncbi:MAG: hypothetical protein ABSF43_12110 [Rectinemataceae bacterium]